MMSITNVPRFVTEKWYVQREEGHYSIRFYNAEFGNYIATVNRKDIADLIVESHNRQLSKDKV